MPCKTDRLMVDALHQAAIARDHPGPVVDQFIAKGRVQMALSHCHAHCGGKPLPQRASRRLNARQLKIFRMARAGAVELTKVADVLQGRPGVTRQMKERVDQHRPMPSRQRSEEHTSELQSLMRISYAVFCLKKKKTHT